MILLWLNIGDPLVGQKLSIYWSCQVGFLGFQSQASCHGSSASAKAGDGLSQQSALVQFTQSGWAVWAWKSLCGVRSSESPCFWRRPTTCPWTIINPHQKKLTLQFRTQSFRWGLEEASYHLRAFLCVLVGQWKNKQYDIIQTFTSAFAGVLLISKGWTMSTCMSFFHAQAFGTLNRWAACGNPGATCRPAPAMGRCTPPHGQCRACRRTTRGASWRTSSLATWRRLAAGRARPLQGRRCRRPLRWATTCRRPMGKSNVGVVALQGPIQVEVWPTTQPLSGWYCDLHPREAM